MGEFRRSVFARAGQIPRPRAPAHANVPFARAMRIARREAGDLSVVDFVVRISEESGVDVGGETGYRWENGEDPEHTSPGSSA